MSFEKTLLISFIFLFVTITGVSQKKQEKEVMGATMVGTASYMRNVPALAGRKSNPEKPRKGKGNPRRTDANKIVPGKGYPRGADPLLLQQKSLRFKKRSKAPSLTFEANATSFSPSDPTGAIGPNHYVSAKNYGYAIHDRSGNLLKSGGLEDIFPGENLGDPIVFYDSFASRFVVTQFSDTPNGFLVAVCRGSDPVNDGWYTYRFNTDSFPDYTKFSIWSDGYYVTANKDQNTIQTSEIVYVIEREKMLQGADGANVKMVGFPLPGARIGGFYSPASFNAIGNTLPPDGDARIIYYQDDGWQGVNQDILKLWKINVNWVSPSESTIAEAEELVVTPFDSTFDGGSFGNIPQPGGTADDIDVLQGAVMYATNYRRFCTHNSVVLNFAVDIDPDEDDISGIRWYELRQNGDGEPWTVYQEGTYTSPDGKSAWCGSMAMDVFGNIGMGYTTMGTTANGATADSYASIRYTGRLATDPINTMTFAEETIAIGTGLNLTEENRYGDYAQLTVDPVDDQTFWHIAEYFVNVPSSYSRNAVGVFKISDNTTADVGVIRIDAPQKNSTYTNAETITVTLKNYGSEAQSNIAVDYTIDGGTPVTEVFAGPINPGEEVSFTFVTTTNLTANETYMIMAETNLAGDLNPENDCSEKKLYNLFAKDVGIGQFSAPVVNSGLTSDPEPVTVTIYNYGGVAQSNIPLFYSINGVQFEETYTGTVNPQEEASHTFSQLANATGVGSFEFIAGTRLVGDSKPDNDTATLVIERAFCRPTSNCAQFGDGIISFTLSNVENTSISCNSGYEDFTEELVIKMNPAIPTYVLTVQTGFADQNGSERMSLWIDFDDDLIFEESELLLDNEIIKEGKTDQEFTITINNQTPVGKHLLRIRAGDVNQNNGAPLNSPCESMDFGSTHDYIVDIGKNPDKNQNTSLIVITKPENRFLITKTDPKSELEEARLDIINMLGQIVASNIIKKDANGTFIYKLNMSYAKSGVYFARLGKGRNAEIARFVVR